ALAFACAAKVVAFVAIVPLLLDYWRRQNGSWRKSDLASLRAIIAPAVFLAGWCAYQWRVLGSPFLFLTDESTWGRQIGLPFYGIINGVRNVIANGHLTHSGPVYILDLFAIALLAAAAIYLWRRGLREYSLVCALLWLSIACTTVIDSSDRYILAAFPV